MKLKYKVDKKNHKSQFKFVKHVMLGLLLLLPFFYFTQGMKVSGLVFGFKVMLIAQLVAIIPSILIHYRYFVLNKNIELVFDKDNKKLVILNKGDSLEYSLEDIECIDTYRLITSVNNSVATVPWQEYSYSIFRFKLGREVIITSLLVPNLRWPIDLPNEKFHVHYLLCWI